MMEMFRSDYDSVKMQLSDNTLSVVGSKVIKGHRDGLGGQFDFYELGQRLFTDDGNITAYGSTGWAIDHAGKSDFVNINATGGTFNKVSVSGFIGANGRKVRSLWEVTLRTILYMVIS